MLGPTRAVAAIDWPTIDDFVRRRRAGTLTVPGHTLRADPSNATIAVDIEFLQRVLRWGRRLRDPRGERLLGDDPLAGYPRPIGDAPRRPVATYDRFLALAAVADAIDPQRLFGPFLELVEALGWCVTALCRLWASDVDRTAMAEAPHGRLRKRRANDKERVEMWVPLSAAARAALDRVLERRPVVGDTWLFPTARAQGKPWGRWHARELLTRAEKKAKLPPLEGGDFHPYRRKWVTEREHLPDADVAAAGGWKNAKTLQLCYQQPDAATMLAVVSEPRKLREAK